MKRNLFKNLDKKELQIFYFGVFSILSILLFQSLIDYEFVISDLIKYKSWSFNLLSNTEPHQLPGMPALTSLTRTLTFSLIETFYLMQLIALLSWLALFYFSKEVLKIITPRTKDIGLLLFSLYPLFGIAFIAYPIPDLPSHAAFSATIFYFLKSDNKKFTLFFILCSFMHKAMWPSLFLILLLSLYKKKIKFNMALLCLLPLALYYLTIYFYNDYSGLESLGIFRNLSSDMALEDKDFYLFKGLFESLTIGSVYSTIKASLTLAVVIGSFFLLFHSVKERNYLFVLLIIPTLALAAIIGEFTSLGVLRHCKFLIIPFCYFLCNYPKITRMLNETLFIYIASGLVLSQLIFHWYNFVGAYL